MCPWHILQGLVWATGRTSAEMAILDGRRIRPWSNRTISRFRERMFERIASFFRTHQHGFYWVGLPLVVAVIGTLIADYLVESTEIFNAAEEARLVRLKQFGTPEPNPAIVIIGIGEETG